MWWHLVVTEGVMHSKRERGILRGWDGVNESPAWGLNSLWSDWCVAIEGLTLFAIAFATKWVSARFHSYFRWVYCYLYTEIILIYSGISPKTVQTDNKYLKYDSVWLDMISENIIKYENSSIQKKKKKKIWYKNLKNKNQ